MTPGARLQAAIELLDRIDAPAAGESDLPADAVLNAYFRARRYPGAKDRRAIADAVFDALRRRGAIDWRLRQAGLPACNRFRAAAAFQAVQGAEAVIAACDGGPHRPVPLAPDEAQRFAALPALSGAAVLADRASFPAWLTPEIERQFGADAAAEMAALTAAAPTDLRANGLKATREDAAAALAAEGVATTPTPLSPLGLRLATRANLAGLRAFRDGLVEVQDEASQLVALMAGAAPGMAVLDLCAGAGGKTLALAAAMRNRGRLLACDTDARRLARLGPRLARSGAAIVETRALRGGENLGGFDRVLVDAPCSGSGTWRRHPDAKWRLTPERLDTYRAAQAALLREGAARVKQGGRLVFATCSLLPSEGRGRIEAFLAEAGGTFRIVDALPALGPAPYLLTPHRHGTDGFFAAVLERRA